MDRLTNYSIAKKADLTIIFNNDNSPNPNFYYFTGCNAYGALVIPKGKNAFIVTVSRDFESAKKSGIKTYNAKKGKKLFEELSEIVAKNKISHKTIGVDKENYNLLVFEKLKKNIKGKYIDISQDLKKLRSVKSNDEIKYLKKACSITDNIFKKIISDFKFKTEKEICEFIEAVAKKQGGELSFPPIVASGKNASIPHYCGNLEIKKGFLLLDFGAKYKGYHADMSRTVYIGAPTKKEVFFYECVLSNQEKCIEYAKAGAKGGELYSVSLKQFGKYKKKFIHSLGHGVGLQIHEYPNLSPESEELILENSTFTVEPGLYFENKFGIRIEDTILIKNKKPIQLTKSRKELIIIEPNNN
ncbi:MAG: Xaa-Pro peptidase family protein [archaeon]